MKAVCTRNVQAWYCVAFMVLLIMMANVDRYILTLIVSDVTRDLSISDKQMGVILGAAFSVIYVVAGLPLAYVIDRSRRIRVIAAGVLLWSLSTMLGALSNGFAELAITRVGVAIGEAVVNPAAVSLIGDLFTKERRALPISIYAATTVVGGMASLVLSGALLDLIPQFPVLAGYPLWRSALVLVGMPGLFFSAILLATVPEPERMHSSSATVSHDAGWTPFFVELKVNWKFYLPFYVAIGGGSMYSLGMVAWAPTILQRVFHVSQSQAGYLVGGFGVPAAIAGAFIWPYVVTRLIRRGRPHAALDCLALAALVIMPIMIGAPLVGAAVTFVLGLALVKILFAQGSLTPVVVQFYGPGWMWGRLTAMISIASHLIGFSLGSYLIPLTADFWAGDPRGLAYGLAVVGVVAGTLMVTGYVLARREMLRRKTMRSC